MLASVNSTSMSLPSQTLIYIYFGLDKQCECDGNSNEKSRSKQSRFIHRFRYVIEYANEIYNGIKEAKQFGLVCLMNYDFSAILTNFPISIISYKSRKSNE